MPTRISTATPTDILEVAELAARTFPLACPPDLRQDAIDAFISEKLSPEAFATYLDDPTHTILCARREDHALIGYALLVDGTAMDETCASLVVDRPTLGISKIYFDRSSHGAGSAREMLTEIERRAVASGLRSIWLATNEHNVRARRFYLKSGFREVGSRIFMVGEVPNTDVVHVKALG